MKRLFLQAGLLLFAGICLLAGCKAAPVESGAGSVSGGTLRYLYAVFPRRVKTEKFLEEIQTLEAKGELAADLGLKKDRHYKKFLLLSARARRSRGAMFIVKEVYKGQKIPPGPFEKVLGFTGDLEGAVKEVTSRREMRGNRIFLKEENIFLGEWGKKKLYLHDLRPLLLKKEWNQMISLAPVPMKQALRENIDIWLQMKLNARLMARLTVHKSEVRRFDHNDVSVLFLSRKYGLASEGIYPTVTFKLPLTPPELLEHFARMRTVWNPIEYVEARATVVKELAGAEEFKKRLEKKEDFLALARVFSRDKKYIKTARLHRVAGYGTDESSKSRERFTILDRLIIETARQNSYKPEIFRVFRGYAIVQVEKIELIKGTFRYHDYKDYVRISLTRILLEKQFPIDVRDTRERLDFKIDRPRVKSLLTEKRGKGAS